MYILDIIICNFFQMLQRVSLGILYLSVCVLQLVCSQQLQCYDPDRLGGPINTGCTNLVNHCLGKQINGIHLYVIL